MKSKKIKPHVSKKKIESVKELSDLLKNKKTIIIASIKSMPASQFQKINKKFMNRAVIKVPKKNIIFKAIDSLNNKELEKIKNEIKEDSAFIFSDDDAFDLSLDLVENKTNIRAKPGQEAPEDIIIEAGPTELMPGPALTELAVVGLKTQIEKGKISIKESKTIVKKGEKISDVVANVMSKLEIKPFPVGFIPVAAFDIKENRLYLNIKISRKETIGEIKNSFAKSLALAVQINYISNDTIKFLIAKAARNEKFLENFISNSVIDKNQNIQEESQSNKSNREEK